jgi:hypothetical protein
MTQTEDATNFARTVYRDMQKKIEMLQGRISILENLQEELLQIYPGLKEARGGGGCIVASSAPGRSPGPRPEGSICATAS